MLFFRCLITWPVPWLSYLALVVRERHASRRGRMVGWRRMIIIYIIWNWKCNCKNFATPSLRCKLAPTRTLGWANTARWWVLLFFCCCFSVGCLTFQQHAGVPQGQISSGGCECCHPEIEVADQTCYVTQSQYTGTSPVTSSADLKASGAWQGNHWSATSKVTGRLWLYQSTEIHCAVLSLHWPLRHHHCKTILVAVWRTFQGSSGSMNY